MEFSKKLSSQYRSKSASEKRRSWTERTHLLTAEKSLFRSLRGPTESTDESSVTDRDEPVNGNYISMVSDSGSPPANAGKGPKRTLGTFDGVFAPVSLSMLRKEFSNDILNMLKVSLSTLQMGGGGCIVQWKNSCFPPSSLGFKSQLCWDFFLFTA